MLIVSLKPAVSPLVESTGSIKIFYKLHFYGIKSKKKTEQAEESSVLPAPVLCKNVYCFRITAEKPAWRTSPEKQVLLFLTVAEALMRET
jgi:hypothetical protein